MDEEPSLPGSETFIAEFIHLRYQETIHGDMRPTGAVMSAGTALGNVLTESRRLAPNVTSGLRSLVRKLLNLHKYVQS